MQCVCLSAHVDILQTLLPCNTSSAMQTGKKMSRIFISGLVTVRPATQWWKEKKKKNAVQCNVVILICAQPFCVICRALYCYRVLCAPFGPFANCKCACALCDRVLCCVSLRMVIVVVVHCQQYPNFGHKPMNIFGECTQKDKLTEFRSRRTSLYIANA